MAGVIRLHDALVQLKDRKKISLCVQDAWHVLSGSPVGSQRSCSNAVPTLSQLDSELMQIQGG